jgi:phage-related protein
MEIFLSYCQKDGSQADKIDKHFKGTEITIKRDIRDIGKWKSIQIFMETVRDTDFVIMIITENYLKSVACMTEVLEAMKEKKYQNRIFPVVVDTRIYNPLWRADIVKYWEREYVELESEIGTIHLANVGDLYHTLEQYQKIKSSVSEFMGMIADRNNPACEEAAKAIDDFLKQHDNRIGKSICGTENTVEETDKDIFSKMGLPQPTIAHVPTDQEKNQFIKAGFMQIIHNLEALLHEFQQKVPYYSMTIEKPTKNDFTIMIYKNGQHMHTLTVFLDGQSWGNSNLMIGVSDGISTMGNHHAYNGIYNVEADKDEMYFISRLALMNQNTKMNADEVAANIWKEHIERYLQ